MLNGCPERAVDSSDNDMIGATCVWMTFFQRDPDSHVCHPSRTHPHPPSSAFPASTLPLPYVCEVVNASVRAEELLICSDAASTLLFPGGQQHKVF